MDFLVKLVQLGPTGAGLAFAILGYRLLTQEMKREGNGRAPMLEGIKFFISMALAFFVVGLVANMIVLFSDKIAAASTQLLSQALSVDATSARITQWRTDQENGRIMFRVDDEGADFSRFIPNKDRDAFRLIVAVRSKMAGPPDNGSYPLAFGPYRFGTIPPQAEAVPDDVKNTFRNACVEYILFRVPAIKVQAHPTTTPFVPSDFGSDIKILNMAYDGAGCP